MGLGSEVVRKMTICWVDRMQKAERRVKMSWTVVAVMITVILCSENENSQETNNSNISVYEKIFDEIILSKSNCITVQQKIPKRGNIQLIEDRLEIFAYLTNTLQNAFYFSQAKMMNVLWIIICFIHKIFISRPAKSKTRFAMCW